MATHSSVFAWRIPMDIGAWGCKELDMTKHSTCTLLLTFPCFQRPTPAPSNYFSTVHVFDFFFFFFNIPHVSDTMQYLSFSVWLISLSIVFPSPSILSQIAGFPS